MFGYKNGLIRDLERENSGLKFDKSMLHLDLTSARLQRDAAADDAELGQRHIDKLSSKLALAERAAKTAINANEEFARLHEKDQTEILELKADIAEQVRVNRSYAEGIGEERRVNDNLRRQLKMHMNSTYGKSPLNSQPHMHFFIDTDSVDTSKPEPETGYGPEYLKLQRQVKRLKAKVAKLTKHNKALSAEVLQSRNSMM